MTSRYDVANSGPIPIKCGHCGRESRFKGLKDRRRYIECECRGLIHLTSEAKMNAAAEYDRRFGPPT